MLSPFPPPITSALGLTALRSYYTKLSPGWLCRKPPKVLHSEY